MGPARRQGVTAVSTDARPPSDPRIPHTPGPPDSSHTPGQTDVPLTPAAPPGRTDVPHPPASPPSPQPLPPPPFSPQPSAPAPGGRQRPPAVRGLTVLYDAGCPLCGFLRDWLAGQPQLVRLDFVPAGSPEARRRFPRLDHASTLVDITVVADGGQVYRGANAWVVCLWALAEYRPMAHRLSTPQGAKLAKGAVVAASKYREALLAQRKRNAGSASAGGRKAGPVGARDPLARGEAPYRTTDGWQYRPDEGWVFMGQPPRNTPARARADTRGGSPADTRNGPPADARSDFRASARSDSRGAAPAATRDGTRADAPVGIRADVRDGTGARDPGGTDAQAGAVRPGPSCADGSCATD